MPEQPVAQVAQHPIPDPVGVVGLQDVEQPGEDRDGDQGRDELDQRREVGAAGREQRLVEHDLDEQRPDHAQTGADHGDGEDQRDAPAVGREQRDDPPADAAAG
jgi:hypothetical protein